MDGKTAVTEPQSATPRRYLAVSKFVLRHPFNFSGRATRHEYIWGMLTIVVVTVLVITAVQFAGFRFFEGAMYWPSMALMFTFILAAYSITARRCHDLGFSGWWAPFISFCSRLLEGGADRMSSDTGAVALGVASIILSLGMFVLLIGKRGQQKDNEYGPAIAVR